MISELAPYGVLLLLGGYMAYRDYARDKVTIIAIETLRDTVKRAMVQAKATTAAEATTAEITINREEELAEQAKEFFSQKLVDGGPDQTGKVKSGLRSGFELINLE